MAQNRYNLLSFIQADQTPPFRQSDFWSNWDWFVKPLLSSFVRRGPQAFGGRAAAAAGGIAANAAAGPTLPPLWPGDMFALHRLHARKLFDRMATTTTTTTQPSTSDEQQSAAEAYLERLDAANVDTMRDAATKSFGQGSVRSAGNSSTVRPWVKQISSLVDPYSFPLESVVYGAQQTLADSLEVIEQNSSTLERYRRERVIENMQLYEEINRLQSALYVLERLHTNLDRVVSSEG